MKPETQSRQFETLLSQILLLTEKLAAQLSKESEALKGRSPEQLNQVSRDKKELVAVLDQKTAQLNHFLAQQQLPGNKKGIEQLLNQFPNNHPNNQNWKKIVQLTEECEKLNNINGTTVRVMQQHAKRCLDILRGNHRPETFYGADGYSQRESVSNSILTV